jgi:pyruvate/2-oxoglutarate dehydrogenase complex dihydrolipoamide acyltransferase (E2) component
MMTSKLTYRTEKIPKIRRFSVDAGHLARRRHIIHALLEVDVTTARLKIREYQHKQGERLSFTAYLINCLGTAIQSYPHVHAYRDWRNRLVLFDDININTMIETSLEGHQVPMPHIFEAVNQKSLLEIHREIRSASTSPTQTNEARFMNWFLVLPGFIRRTFYYFVMRIPILFRSYSSSVMVTSVGMFGKRGGWGIPAANFTLTITVGGITQKPLVFNDEIMIREVLDMTVSLDHDIVDGAPMARFAEYFRQLLESGYGLDEIC